MSRSNLEQVLFGRSMLIDKEMEKIIPKSGIPNLHDAAWYTLSSGGKRLRPSVGLLCAEILGGNVNHALRFSAAGELLHNFLLVHDDIEDGDMVRRNRPATWVKFGLAHGINVGDFLYSKVYEAISSLRQLGLDDAKVLDLFAITVKCITETGEGQAMEINARKKDDMDQKQYLQIARMKTGNYLTLPIIGAAIISNSAKSLVDSIRKYGFFVGPAFQIQDDILDLTEGKGRCEIGCDIKEGKRSFMVVHTAANCTLGEKKELFRILNKTREKKNAHDISRVIELFDKYEAIDSGQNEAKSLILRGKKEVANAPDRLRDVLHEFADYSIKRLH